MPFWVSILWVGLYFFYFFSFCGWDLGFGLGVKNNIGITKAIFFFFFGEYQSYILLLSQSHYAYLYAGFVMLFVLILIIMSSIDLKIYNYA